MCWHLIRNRYSVSRNLSTRRIKVLLLLLLLLSLVKLVSPLDLCLSER